MPDGPADNLPPGWLPFEDDTGDWYYYNETTQETTWDKPQLPKAASKPPAKPAAK
eukprot:CAMPEP_0182547480 /NCGR_PEP_ID=MMETSP1323-20130603/37509_1 /TAXON_ID=236787 /ORGANISM="Florenciella parvula, Strain RCC1693" /LENGTH=54 /DNA_ID=CAMNT_0024758791 /DNA_START=123 /DNA_END=284 /DNA_ORIENTATION=+